MRREFRHKLLRLLLHFRQMAGLRRPDEQNSLYFSQLAGNLGSRDGFARDCLLQGRVGKPSVPLEIGPWVQGRAPFVIRNKYTHASVRVPPRKTYVPSASSD